MAYSENNIEDMIESINNNNLAIKSLVEQTHCNSRIIDNKMSDYAKSCKRLNNEQMTAYKAYAGEFKIFKESLSSQPSVMFTEIYKSQNIDTVADRLKEVHKEQITVMDFLCSLLEKSQKAIATLR